MIPTDLTESEAQELARLRDEVRGVSAVNRALESSEFPHIQMSLDGFFHIGAKHGERYEPWARGRTIAALGLELLKQGKVTL